MKPAWEAACDFNDACSSWLDEGELRRLSRLLESHERHGRRSRDAEVAALRRERDEAVRLLRDLHDLGRESECGNHDDDATADALRAARAFLAKTKGAP